MSVHLFKRSPLADTSVSNPAVPLPGALDLLQHWARVCPLSSALRHKRRGHWYDWRWIDALRDVQRLADGLRQQGVGARSRLVLSGPFQPDLLLLALAAQSVGAAVLSLGEGLGQVALCQALWRLRPSHAFVPDGPPLQRWLAASASGPAPRLLTFAALLGAREPPRRWTLRWRPAAGSQLWSEEGSEWPDGLKVVLQQWLHSGHSLAFPERRDSADRDRREVAPSGLLLSAPGLQRLAEAVDTRLGPAGHWRRRLWQWANARPRGPLQRLIGHRMRRALGLQRLHDLWQAPGGAERPWASPWLAGLKRNIP
ncbi:AMP-binding protein [Pseudomonas sp. NPDC089530]|uniref:AMP-binding protein n=1 Tax=Pseudomonas sp. NPDC089530 TaxID=3390651 RepID=UPI003D00B532